MLHVRNPGTLLGERRVPAPAKEPAPEPTETATASQPTRDPFFDNAKYLAIVLVATGHAWAPFLSTSRSATALYMFVYTFHMPAFVLIAGYFSRSFTGRPDQLRRLITGIGVPYVIFEVAYVLFHRQVHGEDYPFSLLDPYYVTWFLVALFIWRLTAPLWRIVRWPLPLALGIAALATFSPHLSDNLNIQRVLQFLPFFVLGLVLRREHFTWLRDPRVRAAAVPTLLLGLAVAYWAVPRMSYRWFYRTDAVQEMGHLWWTGPVMSLALFASGLVLAAAFLALVPTRATWYTALGAGTLYGYLLHGFLAKGSRWWGWYEHDWISTPAGQVAVTAAAAVIVTLLCTAPVRRLFRPLVEPGLSWAFATPERRVPASSAGRPPAPAGGSAQSSETP